MSEFPRIADVYCGWNWGVARSEIADRGQVLWTLVSHAKHEESELNLEDSGEPFKD